MKKTAVIMAATAMMFCASPLMAQDKMIKDGVTMKDGKVWTVKYGKTTEMTQDIVLSDGSKVMTNGQVVMKNGTTKMLHDGESISSEGKWRMHKTKEERKAEEMNKDMPKQP